MTKYDWVEGILFAGFRIMAMGLMLMGVVAAFFQLAASWYQFDPSYFGAFFFATLFRPLIVILAGAALHLLAGKLASTMAARFKVDS